jgi:hypothetical protein
MQRYRTIYKIVCLLLVCQLFATSLMAQTSAKKNTISINISNPFLFGIKSNILGYERVLKNNQTARITLGRTALPNFKGTDEGELQLTGNSNDKGFHAGVEYRFYLKKENKYEAPRGVYLGAYYSYNSFSRRNQWELNTTNYNGDVNTDFSFKIHTVGAQLGYQFLFWDKLSLDLILVGPGIANYGLNAGLRTTLSPEDEALFFEQLNDYLKEKIPGYNLVLGSGNFKKKGTVNTTAPGFRYMMSIGFHF